MPPNTLMVQVGSVLYGSCGSDFGRMIYGPLRVEAVGADWVVARNERGEVYFAEYSEYQPGYLQERLQPYLSPEVES